MEEKKMRESGAGNPLGIVETTSPICSRSARKKKHKHPDQIRGGDGEITFDGVGGRGGLTQDGGLAGIVEAEDEDAGLAVAEDRREEPREDDAHGGGGGAEVTPARAAEGGGLGQGFGGGGGGDLRRGGEEGGRSGSELARASTQDDEDDSPNGEGGWMDFLFGGEKGRSGLVWWIQERFQLQRFLGGFVWFFYFLRKRLQLQKAFMWGLYGFFIGII